MIIDNITPSNWLESLDTASLELNNQNSVREPKVFRQRMGYKDGTMPG